MASNRQICRWCGALINDSIELERHEQLHRQLDGISDTGWQNEYQKYLQHTNIRPERTNNPCKCTLCGKLLSRKDARLRHEKVCKGILKEDDSEKTCSSRKDDRLRHDKVYKGILKKDDSEKTCSQCRKVFTRKFNKTSHEKTCGKDHICSTCHKRYSTAHRLQLHMQWHGKPDKGHRNRNNLGASHYRCSICHESFQNRHDLYLHRMKNHQQTGGALQRRPWNRDPWVLENGRVDEDLRKVYEANTPHILEPHREGPVSNVYNYPEDNSVTIDRLVRYAREIYDRQQRAFRLNMCFGVILRNRENGQHRYFVPYNNGILERPLYVSKRSDLHTLRLRLERLDITTELLRQRPDTKWIPVLVTNVHYNVYVTKYPIGCGDLPDYLLRKVSVYPLVRNQHTARAYNDDLCAFRCLALHKGYNIKSIEGPSKTYAQQWMQFKKIRKFEALDYQEFSEFESCFGINVEVYSLEKEGFAYSVYKSEGLRDTTMYVNLHENHLSYIRDFQAYAKKYRCKSCDRHFDNAHNLNKHQKICLKTKFVYPGGFHQATINIFERLDQYDIHVPEDQRTFPWFICFDFEAILQTVNDQPTDSLRWTQNHVPISVAIASNVEGNTEAFCIVETDQDTLVQSMVEEMNRIASDAYELAEEKWGWVLEIIDKKLEEDKKREGFIAEEEEEEEDEEEMDAENRKVSSIKSHPLMKLYGQFKGYMSQVPVLGFNSAKYDLNLIKRCLAKHLNMHDDSGTFTVKRNNCYMCIATKSLKFLDISQFLAAGSSYDSFLKAYRATEQKGYFCYEWFDNVAKLEATTLPSHESFYSKLKASNITEDQYLHCQHIWREHKMTTFRDYLIYYNLLDVRPFVEAVEKFQQFYFQKNIDVFKTAISVPGIARQLLFKVAKRQKVNFALFDKNNKDLYQTVKQNIVGGPSIIFTRHHCAGQTRIRGQKPCGSILGFDANALYLQAIGQPMPVGPYVRRLAHNEFRPELRDKYMMAYHWMDWVIHIDGLDIQHKLNTGREVVIGKYPVDGYLGATDLGDKSTVYQFHGCYWHGHACNVTRGVKDKTWNDTRARTYARTQKTTAYLKREHHVVEMWECQFQQYCRQNPAIYQFINSKRPGFFQKHKGRITEDVIVAGIDSGSLFGMVEVDIEVPKEWPPYFQHPTMTPFEYYQEMSPLFCTIDIPFDAIGEHMQAHIRTHHLSEKPRKLLVGGMKARQILLATPLLKWYLNHGLIVTRIYQVVEFQQQRCFQEFVSEVSDARRQGDADPDTAIIADTNKVIGNSGYGSLIMDKTKHREVEYIQGENETRARVNDPRFCNLDCLDEKEQYYELQMAKRKIKLDLPIQLGYFILQYAKLRMLEFYYDFMDVYVDRSDFEYCEMDTDSAYMAISGSCLENVLKPEIKDKYIHGLTGFCTDVNIEADAQHHWFPRTCCSKHASYDKRTPGLFKLEYQGDEMIGLCSKTYIVRRSKLIKPSSTRLTATRLLNKAKGRTSIPIPLKIRRIHDYKYSSKGVSKRYLIAPMTKFRRVLKTGNTESGVNRGFRVRNNAIFTYTLERRGFSYLYCKRKVLKDGIHTAPLNITLCPLPSEETEVTD